MTNPDLPVTEISAEMISALAPHPVEPIDEPEPLPKPITRKEYDQLIEQLMTHEQIVRLKPVLGDGDANPAYNRATQRLTNHYNALQKLQEAGIPESDPRLARFRRPKPSALSSSEPGALDDQTSQPSEECVSPELTREEAERLARSLMTIEQYRAVQSIVGVGESHPEYHDTVRRMYDHAEAKLKLHRAGLLEQYAPPDCRL